MTPMQEQYKKIRSEYKDAVILFRLGDFYETFDEDAKKVSSVLGITLTGRGKDENRVPMAGIPYHALKNYLPKLIEAGLKVVIADQMEEPMPGKLVERQVTKVITPGTVLDETSLDSSKNNYIAAIYAEQSKTTKIGLVYADLSTGSLLAFETDSLQQLKQELNKLNVAEVLVSEGQTQLFENIWAKPLEKLSKDEFDLSKTKLCLTEQFGTSNLKGFGIEDKDWIIKPAGALIKYLIDCQKTQVQHIKAIRLYTYNNLMQLDFQTIRNLELIFPMHGDNMGTTIFGVLNKCINPMGKRKLRNWILYPLINKDMLQERFDAVDFFFNNPIIVGDIRSYLGHVSDLERLTGRLGVNSANPKDIIAIKNSLEKVLEINNLFAEQTDLPVRLRYLISQFDKTTEEGLHGKIEKLIEIIGNAIKEDPSALLNEGGIIKEGYHSQVDEFRNLRQNSKQILAQMQQREIEATKISSLKISFNSVFGYYIEVTRSHLDKVPASYIRKQTLANAERFITQELKELEEKILSAEEKLNKLELELFIKLRDEVAQFIPVILKTADIIAEIDCYVNFGFISRENQYVKPVLSDEDKLLIDGGRHPVIEKLVDEFTKNDLDFSDGFIHILTGPNMSGKSTYIRQAAVITLIAQIGCFVPANKMEFSIVDRIFTRVGASDNLAMGESTFMVEMTETANILNSATDKSLIILDEVGRGTSTYDGVAIAWSIIEYIYKHLKSKTLFATHYHELIELEKKYDNIKNYNVEVLEHNGEVLFKHKIIKGATNKSYGVHVAKIAGVPSEVIKNAELILKGFESNQASPQKEKSPTKPKKIHPEQLSF